ncbi:hypothetical protein B5F07_02070 [Lachnoclostridium sp. An169]|uniref:carboxylesterase/lipase family protein n=1 Tax=Lachnoclostridium sp. An169 TaxID=1965569 RepID=UPI000B36CEFF|nr:carboxylesterase family protein [Lachnoclostridium sp. An169]OUP86112.1 hypothetical protein B5F07_02070 [Lachnoclostridium sp. An169]
MSHVFTYGPGKAVVETTYGKIRGYEYDNISIFKGIPYARARRFHAPEPVEPWEGERDATNYGYVCPLLNRPQANGELMVPHRYWIENEDCLNLNIWTPGCDDGKRPVLVWLHGGGFREGSAIEQVAYEGENMCREGQAVVVSVNHRLNVLGFCDLSAFGEEYANSGNAGMDDIIAALRWIRDNIAKFGGDPDNMTLFGQSGGGAKITTLLQMPAADGLYAKGIIMSGIIGPVLADSEGSGEELVRAMMKELKLTDVKELEKVSYGHLAAAYNRVSPKLQKEGKYIGGTPHPNAFYRGTPEKNGFRQETARIPLVIGTVFGEFTAFSDAFAGRDPSVPGEEAVKGLLGADAAAELLPLFEKAYPERDPAEVMMLDFIFRLPTQEYIKIRSGLNDCTYSYLFDLNMAVGDGRAPWHCADIPFVFRNTELVPVTQQGEVTKKVEEEVFGCVMAFAEKGDPNHSKVPHWSASDPETEHTMVFGKETAVKDNFDRELVPLVAKYMGPVFARGFNTETVQH